jgi:putative hemolysin
MKMVSIITAPFIWLLTHATEFFVENSADKPNTDGNVTEEEIKFIREGTEGGSVQEIEQDIVERVFILVTEK